MILAVLIIVAIFFLAGLIAMTVKETKETSQDESRLDPLFLAHQRKVRLYSRRSSN